MACFQYQQGIISEERMSAALTIYINLVVGFEGLESDFVQAGFAVAPGLDNCTEIAISTQGINLF